MSDLRETIQSNGRNVSLGVFELNMYFFVQFPQASQEDNVECVSVLLAHNADPNLIDSSGNTAFHHAVSRGNIPIVKMLLEHNVDIEAKTEVKLFQLHSQYTFSSDTQTYSLHAEAQDFSLNLFRGTLFSPNRFFIIFGS